MEKTKKKNTGYRLSRFVFWLIPTCLLWRLFWHAKYKNIYRLCCMAVAMFFIIAFIFVKEVSSEYTVVKDNEWVGISYIGSLAAGKDQAAKQFGNFWYLPLKYNEMIFHLECEKYSCEVWGFDNETIYKLASIWGTEILDIYTIPDWALPKK